MAARNFWNTPQFQSKSNVPVTSTPQLTFQNNWPISRQANIAGPERSGFIPRLSDRPDVQESYSRFQTAYPNSRGEIFGKVMNDSRGSSQEFGNPFRESVNKNLNTFGALSNIPPASTHQPPFKTDWTTLNQQRQYVERANPIQAYADRSNVQESYSRFMMAPPNNREEIGNTNRGFSQQSSSIPSSNNSSTSTPWPRFENEWSSLKRPNQSDQLNPKVMKFDRSEGPYRTNAIPTFVNRFMNVQQNKGGQMNFGNSEEKKNDNKDAADKLSGNIPLSTQQSTESSTNSVSTPLGTAELLSNSQNSKSNAGAEPFLSLKHHNLMEKIIHAGKNLRRRHQRYSNKIPTGTIASLNWKFKFHFTYDWQQDSISKLHRCSLISFDVVISSAEHKVKEMAHQNACILAISKLTQLNQKIISVEGQPDELISSDPPFETQVPLKGKKFLNYKNSRFMNAPPNRGPIMKFANDNKALIGSLTRFLDNADESVRNIPFSAQENINLPRPESSTHSISTPLSTAELPSNSTNSGVSKPVAKSVISTKHPDLMLKLLNAGKNLKRRNKRYSNKTPTGTIASLDWKLKFHFVTDWQQDSISKLYRYSIFSSDVLISSAEHKVKETAHINACSIAINKLQKLKPVIISVEGKPDEFFAAN